MNEQGVRDGLKQSDGSPQQDDWGGPVQLAWKGECSHLLAFFVRITYFSGNKFN